MEWLLVVYSAVRPVQCLYSVQWTVTHFPETLASPSPAPPATRQPSSARTVLAQSRAQAGKIWRIWPLAVSHSQTCPVRDTGIYLRGNCICSGGTRIQSELIMSLSGHSPRAKCERDIMTFWWVTPQRQRCLVMGYNVTFILSLKIAASQLLCHYYW